MVEIEAPIEERYEEVLTDGALALVGTGLVLVSRR